MAVTQSQESLFVVSRTNLILLASVPAFLLFLLCAVSIAQQKDKYGGNTNIKMEATGCFRVEQINDRWLFVTPAGHGYVALGANHVGKYLDLQAKEMGLLSKYDNDRPEAARFLIDEMKQMGLTAGEAYAPIAPELKDALPWVANLTLPVKSKFAFDVFDPDFQKKLQQSVIEQCVELRNDPMVLGIAFYDLPVWDHRRVKFFETLDSASPGGKQLAKYRAAGKSDDEFLGHVADVLYEHVAKACRAGAPNHLFFGERHRLRGTPDEVLRSVGKHVDVFCTQALILSPQRPPEWQVFQAERYDYEQQLTRKPMVIIDWAAPFSLTGTLQTEKGTLYPEEKAAQQSAAWLIECLQRPYMVGVFKCQLIGLHGNDRWFDGKARRTYLKDDGSEFEHRTEITRKAHQTALQVAYQEAIEKGEFSSLFNGKDLEGWTIHSGKATFEVVDGEIVGTTAPMTPNSFLCTDREYGDFELELEVQCDPNLNSGIQIRSQIAEEGTQVTNTKNPQKPKTITLPKGRVYGYQVEIAKAVSGRSGGVYDEARRFVFLDDLSRNPEAQKAFKDGQWNQFRIRCEGNHIRTWVNDIPCADVRDEMDSKGVIGLQVHGNISVTGRVIHHEYHKRQVRFRNLRIHELPQQESETGTSRPYSGTPIKIPGRVETEQYDLGGENVAYHDTEDANLGNGKLNVRFDNSEASFRRDEGVDLSFTKKPRGKFAGDLTVEGVPEQLGALYVGWTKPGEWIRYTVNVEQSGHYVISGHVSAGNENASLGVHFGGNDSQCTFALPYTKSAHRWTTSQDLGTIELSGGLQTMTLRVDRAGGFNVDWLEFTLVENQQ